MRDVLRCPACKIRQGKYRSKKDNYKCAVCGHVYEKEEVKEDEE
jgi:rubredoxin